MPGFWSFADRTIDLENVACPALAMAGATASLGILTLMAGKLVGAASIETAPSRPAVKQSAPCLLALRSQALAYFPAASRRATGPAPIIVLLHGGGSNP